MVDFAVTALRVIDETVGEYASEEERQKPTETELLNLSDVLFADTPTVVQKIREYRALVDAIEPTETALRQAQDTLARAKADLTAAAAPDKPAAQTVVDAADAQVTAAQTAYNDAVAAKEAPNPDLDTIFGIARFVYKVHSDRAAIAQLVTCHDMRFGVCGETTASDGATPDVVHLSDETHVRQSFVDDKKVHARLRLLREATAGNMGVTAKELDTLTEIPQVLPLVQALAACSPDSIGMRYITTACVACVFAEASGGVRVGGTLQRYASEELKTELKSKAMAQINEWIDKGYDGETQRFWIAWHEASHYTTRRRGVRTLSLLWDYINSLLKEPHVLRDRAEWDAGSVAIADIPNDNYLAGVPPENLASTYAAAVKNAKNELSIEAYSSHQDLYKVVNDTAKVADEVPNSLLQAEFKKLLSAAMVAEGLAENFGVDADSTYTEAQIEHEIEVRAEEDPDMVRLRDKAMLKFASLENQSQVQLVTGWATKLVEDYLDSYVRAQYQSGKMLTPRMCAIGSAEVCPWMFKDTFVGVKVDPLEQCSRVRKLFKLQKAHEDRNYRLFACREATRARTAEWAPCSIEPWINMRRCQCILRLDNELRW